MAGPALLANRPAQPSRPAERRVARLSGPAAGGLALLGYLLLTVALTYPLITRFTSAIPGDSFDGWQNYWNLWWVRTAVLDQHTHPWFTGLLYHPTGVGLLFHTLNAFNGFTFLPVQLAWGLLPAYNAVVLFSFTVGGLGAYLLARQALGPKSSRGAAFVAGLIFTFSPYHIAHLLGHMQLISLEWIPFFALYVLRAVDRPARRRRNSLIALLFLVLVTLCDWYYLLYCLLFSAVVAAWLIGRALVRAITARRQAGRNVDWGAALVRPLFALAAIWGLWALLLSPLLLPMVAEARQYDFMVPDPAQSRILSADLLAYVLPQEFHPLWGQWAQQQAKVFTATVSEHQVFAGFTVIGLVIVAVTCQALGKCLARRGGYFAFWLFVLVVFWVLSLGPVLHVAGQTDLFPSGGEIALPYGWLAQVVPFLDITRSVSRYATMVMLALGVLAAAGVDFLARRPSRRPSLRLAAPVIASALLIFELIPVPYPVSPPDTPGWYATLAADSRPGAVLNLPANWDRPGYLLYQTEHGKPLAMAYISREDPRTLADRAPVLQHFRHLGPDIIQFDLARQGEQVLADLGIRWVVLDRYQMPGGKQREYTEAAAREVFGDRPAVYEDDRLTVYEVGDPSQNAPYLVLGEGWEPFDAEQGTRSFTGDATVIVQAREPGAVTLRVTLAEDSPTLDLPRDGDAYVLALDLKQGANEVRLNARNPADRVTVTGLALEIH